MLKVGDTLLDRYEVETVLEPVHDEFYRNYKAKDLTKDGRYMLIREFPNIESADPRDYADDMYEMDLFQSMNNELMPSILTDFEQDGNKYYVMEWMDGPSLQDQITEFGPLEYDKVAKYMEELLSVLDFLAVPEQGGGQIVFRSINPRTVRTNDMEDKLFIRSLHDAQKLEDGVYAKHPIQNDEFMDFVAPEAVDMNNPLSPVMDVYSAGALMYYLLTGNRPDADKLLDPRDFNKDVPVEAAYAVIKATRKNPKDRFASAKEMQDVISHIA